MGLSLSRFTQKAQESILAAQQLAKEKQHAKIDPEHLLLTLIKQPDGLAHGMLVQSAGDRNGVDKLASQLERHLERLPRTASSGTQPYVSKKLQSVIVRSEREAASLRDEFTAPEHLLIGLSLDHSGVAQELLRNHGINRQSGLGILRELRGSGSNLGEVENPFGALDKYCVDLIQQARSAKLDPVIGRDDEVRRVIQVLSRRRKNNPVLIGEPGVGKTAIVEGLAQRILAGDVPESLRNKRIMSLDLGALVGGAKFRGDFEDRVKSIISAVESAAGAVIVFIDELHTIVGAGASEGTLDAGNMLKPALARGSLRCVGATTLQEYKKYIEKDPALERRFQQIIVNEPSAESTIAILRGLKEKYEVHHGIRIKDSAIIAAARLSERYLSERFLPDKAIDLIDESSANLCIEIDSLPTELDKIDRRVMQLEIEAQALKNEDDPPSKERLKKLEKELFSLKQNSQEKKEKWQKERNAIRSIRELQEKIERTRQEEQEAQRAGNLELAARLKYGVLDELNKNLTSANQKLRDLGGKRMLREAVEEQDIASVLHRWTGIPVERMLQSERHKLLQMEKTLALRVVGQAQALKSVSNAIRRSRAGIQDPDRPIASLIFAGSTGVGKTELARSLAAFLFDDERSMLRLDMSEYMEKHSVARMIGAPPGYIGFEEGGSLTEAVRRRPYSLLLLDEIEKSHPDIFNLFLQVMDSGRLTNSQGRTVDFRNTVIIMTTNIGQQALQNGHPISHQQIVQQTRVSLRKCFRPEFLNRLDEIIVFQSIDKQALEKIVDIQLTDLQKRLSAQGIRVFLSAEARSYLAKQGFDPHFGVRPLKRVIQQEILDVLASKILEDDLKQGDVIRVIKSEKGRLEFNKGE